jgi:aminoglycoside phosphotransferase (APT) family kinase protein
MPEITTALVAALIADQFPDWADLAVTPVPRQGWDNRTFRLGDELTVRLPSGSGYVAAVEKEHRCLPLLAAHLPLPIPEPVAVGRPTDAYPHPWSVRRWLDGDTLQDTNEVDRIQLARDLAAALTRLRAAPAGDGPAAGRDSFSRGCHPSAYADELQQSLHLLGDTVDVSACEAVWA